MYADRRQEAPNPDPTLDLGHDPSSLKAFSPHWGLSRGQRAHSARSLREGLPLPHPGRTPWSRLHDRRAQHALHLEG